MLTETKYRRIIKDFKNSRTPKLDYLLRNFATQDGEDTRFVEEYKEAYYFDAKTASTYPTAKKRLKRLYLKEGLSESIYNLLAEDAEKKIEEGYIWGKTSEPIQELTIAELIRKVSNKDLAKLNLGLWTFLYSEARWTTGSYKTFAQEWPRVVANPIWNQL